MNSILENEFPPLNSCHSLETFFQNELVFFHFHTARFFNNKEEHLFTKRYCHVLSTLKKYANSSYDFIDRYFDLFYHLVIQTRSIRHGKGEHTLSYLMVYSWYEFFPETAIKMIHQFTHGSHGSWRDIKYLCQYCKDTSTLDSEHPLILTCIDIINNQLKQDLYAWNFSQHPRDRNYISNAAKWIPREKKQHDWLFKKLVVHWVHMKNPHILSTPTTHTSYIKAIHKASRLYRKDVSFLNKILETTEINQCSHTINNINPNTTSAITISKQKNTFFGLSDKTITDEQSIACKTNFERSFYSKLHNTTTTHTNPRIFTPLPIHYYVKEAISLSQLKDTHDTRTQIQVLNHQWKLLSLSFSSNSFQHTIPIIDTTCQDSRIDTLFSSIAFSIMIAQHNKIHNRIFLLGQKHNWISFDNIHHFTDIVTYIYKHIEPVFDLSIHSLFKQIGQTFIHSSSQKQHNHLRFVFFSTFSHSFYNNIPDIYFHEYISNILQQYRFYKPIIAYWNVSNDFNDFLPCKYNDYNTMLLSGFSIPLLHILKSFPKHKIQNPFETVSHILTHTALLEST